MKHNFLAIICSPVLLACLALGAHSETLEEIYQQALENDHLFKAAQATYSAGKESKNLGRSALLPQLGAELSWRDTDTTLGNDDDSQSTATGYRISLQQALFNMSSWREYKSGAANALSSEAQFKNAEQNLIIRTARAYFDALKAVDDLSTAQAEEDALKHQLEQTRQRFQVGLTAVTEVHEAQAAFDSARVNRLSAEGQLGIAFEGLEVITGKPNNELSPLRAEFPVVNPTPADRNQWVEFAMENNYALASASWLSEAAQQTAKARKADHLPTVTAGATFQDFDTDNHDGLDDLMREDQIVEVTLSLPLYSGGRVSASRRQARAGAIEAKENYRQTQRDVIQRTRSLHLAVVTGAASVKARAQAIISSQSALDATQAGYEVGTRDLVDVLNSQRNLFRAQRDYSADLYSYVMFTLELKEAAGMLEPKNVTELSAWLDASRKVSRYKDN